MSSKCILKVYAVPAGMEAGEKSGGCAAVESDLCTGFSIVCLYVCSAHCQETEAWAESLPHKGHSLSAPGSGLPFNRRQTASCMCGQNNSISSVGLNRQFFFVEQLSVCLSQTQLTHVWQWSNICGVCGTSYSSSEGQLHQINAHQFFKGWKWWWMGEASDERRLVVSRLISLFSLGMHAQVQRHIRLLAFQIS